MSKPYKYGNKYWCVKVPKSIAPDGEIYLYADTASIMPTGDLVFYCSGRQSDSDAFQNLALAKGSWIAFFAASVVDNSAISVDYWKGEVVRNDENEDLLLSDADSDSDDDSDDSDSNADDLDSLLQGW